MGNDTPVYDETLALHEMELSEEQPVWLDRYPFLPCDGHAEPTIQAIVRHQGVELCGNCAYRALGIKHQNHATWLRKVDDERKQGDEH